MMPRRTSLHPSVFTRYTIKMMPHHPSLAFSIEDMNKLIRYGADRCDLVSLNLSVLITNIKKNCFTIFVVEPHE